MKIYNYNPVTGEYISEGLADGSPLEPGIYLVPAYATEIQPPETGDNEVACFENESWIVKPDYRGQNFYKKEDLSEVIIAEIGELSDDLLSELPLKPDQYFEWNGEEYVLNIDKKLQAKIQEVLAKEIEAYNLIYKFLGKFSFDYTDATLQAMDKTLLALSLPDTNSIEIMDMAMDFNNITLNEVEAIKSDIVLKRLDLHNQCITFMKRLKEGELDIEIIYQ